MNPLDCSHFNMYHFHENASAYCPDCRAYVDGDKVVIFPKDNILEERRKKINKILTKK